MSNVLLKHEVIFSVPLLSDVLVKHRAGRQGGFDLTDSKQSSSCGRGRPNACVALSRSSLLLTLEERVAVHSVLFVCVLSKLTYRAGPQPVEETFTLKMQMFDYLNKAWCTLHINCFCFIFPHSDKKGVPEWDLKLSAVLFFMFFYFMKCKIIKFMWNFCW